MNMNKNLLLVFPLLLIISLSIVSAEDSTQINNSDVLTTNESSSTNNDYIIDLDDDSNINDKTEDGFICQEYTFTDLNTQFKETPKGSTIRLVNNYSYDANFNLIGVKIDKPLTIEGNGITLDGKNTGRILFITSNDVTLKNINFINGYHTDGSSAIKSTGANLVLINCKFINNYAGGATGGAIFVNNDNCTINNCEFINNSVEKSGGAFRLNGNNHLIENNYFENNQAKNYIGGAFLLDSNNTIIKNNTFKNNKATKDGGAFALTSGSSNLIENNIFIDNEGAYGGAINLYNVGNFTIKDNNFSLNHATDLGGAIRVYISESSSQSKIINNVFSSNFAQKHGGAIGVVGNNILFDQNIFSENNVTTFSGGAIELVGNNNIIQNNNFSKNTAKTAGGAIYIDGNKTKILKNHILSSSVTKGGAGICIVGSSSIINQNIFINNVAISLGGAMQIIGAGSTITKNNFTNNKAGKNGGALSIEGNNMNISENSFTINKAGLENLGGGIKIDGNNQTISKNTFENNTAKNGFAIYGNGNHSQVSENLFIEANPLDSILRWYGDYTVIAKNVYVNQKTTDLTSTTLIVPNKSYSKLVTNKKLTLTLKTSKGAVIKNKSVSFSVNGKVYKAKTNSNGVATVTVKLTAVKTYSFSARFAGDAYYKPVLKTAKLTITKDKPKLTVPNKSYRKSAKTKSLTATLKNSLGKVVANKKITFTVNGKKYAAKTNSKGVATIKVNLKVIKTFKFTVKFAGDSTFSAISKTAKLIIKK